MDHSSTFKYFILKLLILTLGSSSLFASNNCINTQDSKTFELHILNFNQAINKYNLKEISSFINFPITDNHNHVITKRVFLEDTDYEPVVNVMGILEKYLPKTLHDKESQSFIHPNQCQKYIIIVPNAFSKRGVKFVFKKVNSDLQLKLIRFLK